MMLASRRRPGGGQGGMLHQDHQAASVDHFATGGGGPEAESFWSSFSVVESLFSDDHGLSASPQSRGEPQHQNFQQQQPQQNGGSRLPFMRQLKSQEAFPPLPPSVPYEDNSHHHRRSDRNHSQQRRGGGSGGVVGSPSSGSGGEWITPHHSAATPIAVSNGHHPLFPPSNGHNNYYTAFNGYNQHFAGGIPALGEGYGEVRSSSPSYTNGGNGSPSNGRDFLSYTNGGSFSIFSDFGSPRQQNAFNTPDIGGVAVERQHVHSVHHQGTPPRGGIVTREDHHHMNGNGYLSPSTLRKQNVHTNGVNVNGSNSTIPNSNKICCEEDFSYSEEYTQQGKGAPFSLLLALPNEHLLRIMGYLSGRDLANLQQVGKKRLAVLATDNGLWKELYLFRWKLLETSPNDVSSSASNSKENGHHGKNKAHSNSSSSDDEENSSDEWAWIYSLLQQNERWKDIFQSRHSAERWRIGTLKMFNGCWGFISQHSPDGSSANSNGETLDIFFHRKDIAPEGDWYEDWWLKDTPGVSRSQKCGYWDTFLCGRVVRYKQRAAYAQGRRPQACNISFVGDERRDNRGAPAALVLNSNVMMPPSSSASIALAAAAAAAAAAAFSSTPSGGVVGVVHSSASAGEHQGMASPVAPSSPSIPPSAMRYVAALNGNN